MLPLQGRLEWGCIDWANVMPVLEEINYMGPLTLEILYPPISLLVSFVTQSYECLSYLIDQAVGGVAKTQV